MEESVFKVVREGKDYSVIDDGVSKAFVAVIEDYYNKKSWWRFRGSGERTQSNMEIFFRLQCMLPQSV